MCNLNGESLYIGSGTLPAYTDLGGYPLYYITRDGCVLCPECAQVTRESVNKEYQDSLEEEYGYNPCKGDIIEASDINHEDVLLACECGKFIECACFTEEEAEEKRNSEAND